MNLYKKTKYFATLPLLLLMLFGYSSCAEDVAMPSAHINVDTDSIFAPSIESSIAFNIDANCDWTVTMDGDGNSWARVSTAEATGSSRVTLNIDCNETGASRRTVINIANRTNTAFSKLVLTQNPASADGCISVSEIRALAGDASYTFTQDAKMRAIVVSNQQTGNYFPNSLAVAGTMESGNGISVATQENMLVSPGEEIEVNLKGATVGRSKTTGQLTLTPTSDDQISRTNSTQIEPKVPTISFSELAGGAYEGMLVSLQAQVSVNGLSKSNIAGVTTLQDADKNLFDMVVLPTSTFSSTAVPTGSGPVTGIVVFYNGAYCIAPRSAADLNLTNPRYDGGITFPYVLSFFAENANSKGRYIDFYKDNATINNSYIMTKDGTGVTMKLNLSTAGSGQINFLFWADDSGHHNLQLGTFADGATNDVVFVFPLDATITGGLRLQFGWGVQKNGIANWVVEYSVDDKTYYKVNDDEGPTFTIPAGMPYGGGKNYFNFTLDIPKPKVAIERKKTLYVKFHPLNRNSIAGGTVSATGSYGRATAHSCIILSEIPKFSSSKPAGAAWYQPFDGLTEGADYRLGDRLCGLLNYCGSDISNWTTAQSLGMSGTNVRQRPGYAQIGYVESEYTDHKSLKNQPGSLQTPAVGYAGNYEVSFDAIAYNNSAVFQKSGNNTSKDFGGDSRKAVIEVVGGGTIDGAATKVIDNLSYTAFQNYTVTVQGATPSSYIRFKSSDDKAYTRWFIDNITVKKK